MKRYYFVPTISIFLILQFSFVFAQNWEWAIGGKGYDSFDYSNAVVTDQSGNVYIAGYFKSATLTFGTKKITNSGQEDIFVAKFDSKGNCLWNIAFGGQENDRATCMALAGDYLIVSGYFESKPAMFEDLKVEASSGSDIFVVVLNPNNGKVTNLKTFKGDGYDDLNSIFVDNQGFIYLSGEFSGDYLVFGNDTLKNYNYGTIYKGMGDGFVAKLTQDLNPIWALRFGGVSNDRVNTITTDNEGMVYIYGTFNSNFLNVIDTVFNKGYSDIFLFKYDQNNKRFLWQLFLSGTDKEYPASIVFGNDGYLYLTGEFQSDVIRLPGYTLSNSGSYDFFIIKLDKNGNIANARSFGSYADEYAKKIVIDNQGSLYIGGYFASSTFSLDNFILTNSSTDQYADIFVAKFDKDLKPIWVLTAGGKGEDQSFNIAVDNNGNLYQTGNFESREIFFNKTSIFNFGYSNIFIAKLNPNLPLSTELNNSSASGIFVFPNPCTNYLCISLTEEKIAPVKGIIYNSLGVEQLEFLVKENLWLDLNAFENGCYFIKIDNKTLPFIISR
ncbi:MAG: hypothetical protein N2560_06870 [Ignavibacteria bacterium]|nr:hypothetical protein [Ignavibacteria bacterium]